MLQQLAFWRSEAPTLTDSVDAYLRSLANVEVLRAGGSTIYHTNRAIFAFYTDDDEFAFWLGEPLTRQLIAERPDAYRIRYQSADFPYVAYRNLDLEELQRLTDTAYGTALDYAPDSEA